MYFEQNVRKNPKIPDTWSAVCCSIARFCKEAFCSVISEASAGDKNGDRENWGDFVKYSADNNQNLPGKDELDKSGLYFAGADNIYMGETVRQDVEDGVFGLQRGFKKAGANTILMSLWKVDDEATCIRTTPGWEDPKFWAPFILLDALDCKE